MNVPASRPDDEIALSVYLGGVWRYRVGIAIAALVAMGAVGAATLSQPRQYESTLTLMVSASKFGDQSGSGANLNAAIFRPILQSRSVASTVIREFGLDKPPHELTPTSFVENVIDIEDVRGTTLIRLTARFPDRELSARIAQRVAELGIGVAQKVTADETVQARDVINQQLQLALKRYNDADAAVRQFRDGAQIEALKKDVEGTLGLRGGLLELLVRVESERAKVARYDQELSKRNRVDTLKKTVDDAPILAEAARGRPGDAGRAGGAALQLTTEAVSEAYERVDEEAAKARANLSALEKQKTQLADVQNIDAAKLPKLSALYEREGQLARLEVERDIAQKSYVAVATLYETARLQVAARSVRLEVIDPAVPADRPLSRHVVRNTVLAGIAMMSLAALVAMVAEALRGS